jgi:four helix bundle protein
MQFLDPGEPRRGMRKKWRRRIRTLLLHRDGMASELEYHLLLAKDLKLVKPKDHTELSQRATELKRMLTALLQKLNADR